MEPYEYDALAQVEATHPWFVGRRRLLSRLARRLARRWPPRSVLDAGCGTGTNLTEWAAWRPRHLIAADIEQAALEYARRRTRQARFVRADLTRLPFGSNVFDLVVSSDVIEHVGRDDAVVFELARVLGTDGLLLLTTPAYSWAYTYHDAHLHHHRRYDAARLQRLVSAAGLRIVHWSHYNVLPGLPLWAYRRWFADRSRSDVGKPLPRGADRILARVWQLEQAVGSRLQIPFGMSHVLAAVTRSSDSTPSDWLTM